VALVSRVVAVDVAWRYRVCAGLGKVIIAAQAVFITTELYAAAAIPTIWTISCPGSTPDSCLEDMIQI